MKIFINVLPKSGRICCQNRGYVDKSGSCLNREGTVIKDCSLYKVDTLFAIFLLIKSVFPVHHSAIILRSSKNIRSYKVVERFPIIRNPRFELLKHSIRLELLKLISELHQMMWWVLSLPTISRRPFVRQCTTNHPLGIPY